MLAKPVRVRMVRAFFDRGSRDRGAEPSSTQPGGTKVRSLRLSGGVLDSTLGWSAPLPVESRGSLANPPAKQQTAKLKKCPWLPNDSHVGLATPASWN